VPTFAKARNQERLVNSTKKLIWDIEQLQVRFAAKQRMIETELKSLKAHKHSKSALYKPAYDEQLGSLHVFIILETTAALMSPELFVEELKGMLSRNPAVDPDAHSHQHFVNGWKRTLAELLKEFSEYV
jgi:hypothetical protein